MKFLIYTGLTKNGNPCRYCKQAKNLLFSRGYVFEERDRSDGDFERMEFKTIPQIFVIEKNTKEHIGGYTELKEWLENNVKD